MGGMKRCSSGEDFYGEFSKKRKDNFHRLDLLGDIAASGLVLQNGDAYRLALADFRRGDDQDEMSSLCTEVSWCSGEPESMKNPQGMASNGEHSSEDGQARRSSRRVPVLPSRFRDSILDDWTKASLKDPQLNDQSSKEKKNGYCHQDSLESTEKLIPEVPKLECEKHSSTVSSFTFKKDKAASTKKKSNKKSEIEKLSEMFEPLSRNGLDFFNRLAKETSVEIEGSVSCGKVKNGQCTYRLEDFTLGDVVWAKSAKKYPAWPATVINPMLQAPQSILNSCVPGALCVMFFGYSGKDRERDYAWVRQGMVFPFMDCLDRFQGQTQLFKSKPSDFRAAIEEASLAECGFVDPQGDGGIENGDQAYHSANSVPGGIQEATDSNQYQESNSHDQGSLPVEESRPCCNSCGVSLPYKTMKKKKPCSSDQFCKHCYKLLKSKQYCGICKKIWHHSDGGSWIQCDGCKVWVHAECEKISSNGFQDMRYADYFCPECKEKLNPVRKISKDLQYEIRSTSAGQQYFIPDKLKVACQGVEGIYFTRLHL